MLHVTSCEACQHVLALYDGETQFIKETLRNPRLPVNFVDEVLEQVEPRKERRLLTYGYVIALGIIALFIITLLSDDVVM